MASLPVKEWKDVAPWLLHGEKNDPVVLFGVVGEDGDDEVGVEGVQLPGGFLQQQHNWVPGHHGSQSHIISHRFYLTS